MSLQEKDIFNAVFNRFDDKPIEFVMEQYEKVLRINREIETRLLTKNEEEQPEVKKSNKEKFNRSTLLIKPEEAIQDDYIACCICGVKKERLQAGHFAKHGITSEEYKEICGYDKKQPLMSNKSVEKSRKIMKKAQEARMSNQGYIN